MLQINVSTYKGMMQLSGFVDSPKAADRAVEVASRVDGVLEVRNNLIVKSGKPSATPPGAAAPP